MYNSSLINNLYTYNYSLCRCFGIFDFLQVFFLFFNMIWTLVYTHLTTFMIISDRRHSIRNIIFNNNLIKYILKSIQLLTLRMPLCDQSYIRLNEGGVGFLIFYNYMFKIGLVLDT